MNVTITSTPDAFEAAAAVLVKCLNRGDFDDADDDGDFEYAAGEASGRFAQAAHDADDDTIEAVVDGNHLDEILAVIESDRDASTGPLARFITDANTAFEATRD